MNLNSIGWGCFLCYIHNEVRFHISCLLNPIHKFLACQIANKSLALELFSKYPQFQIIIRLTFLTPSLTARLIPEEILLIKQATTKEVIFSTNFWIRRVIKLGVKKIKRTIIWNGFSNKMALCWLLCQTRVLFNAQLISIYPPFDESCLITQH
jgi:hypothetical protein